MLDNRCAIIEAAIKLLTMPTHKNLETAKKYWELYQQGLNFEQIGKSCGVTRQAVWGVLKNHKYCFREKKEAPFKEKQIGAWNSRKVRRLDTGEIYESVLDAARKAEVDRSSIARAIERGGKSAKTKWEYVN